MTFTSKTNDFENIIQNFFLDYFSSKAGLKQKKRESIVNSGTARKYDAPYEAGLVPSHWFEDNACVIAPVVRKGDLPQKEDKHWLNHLLTFEMNVAGFLFENNDNEIECAKKVIYYTIDFFKSLDKKFETDITNNLRFLVNKGGQNLKVLPDDVPERNNKSKNRIVHSIDFDNYPITKIIPNYLKELGFEKQIIFSRPQVKVTASNETLTPFAGVQIEILALDKHGNHIEIGFLNFPAWVRLDKYSKLFKPRIALNIPELHSEEYARRSKYELTHENRYQLILGNQRIVQVVRKIDAWELPKTKPLIEIICKSLKTKWNLLSDDKKEIIFQSIEFLKTSVRASIDGVRANKKLFHGANTELKDCLKYFYENLSKLEAWEKTTIEELIQEAHLLYGNLPHKEINDSIISIFEHLSYKYDLFHVSEKKMISLEKQQSIARLLNHSKKGSALNNAIEANKQKKQITENIFQDFYTDTGNLKQSEVDQILHFIKNVLLNSYSDHEINEKLYYFLQNIGIPTHKDYKHRSTIPFGVFQQIPKYLSYKRKQKKELIAKSHFSKLLVVGLGNYWEGYDQTRHNIGFYALDKFAKQFSFPDFKFLENLEGFYSKKRLHDSEIILFKPAFALRRKDIDQKDVGSINVSGPPTEEAINFFEVQHDRVIIIYDTISKGKSTKNLALKNLSHRGLRDIARTIGMENFEKCKTYSIHVGRPKDKDIAKYVLSNPIEDQLTNIDTEIEEIINEIEQMTK